MWSAFFDATIAGAAAVCAPQESNRSPALKFAADTIARYNANPLYQTIGIRLEEVADGHARAVLTPNPQVCWPTEGQPHGGILFTVLDTTMAFAALSTATEDDACATVDCSIQYPVPARHPPYVCEVSSARRTGRTVFVRAEVLDAHQAPVAIAQGTFRIFKAK